MLLISNIFNQSASEKKKKREREIGISDDQTKIIIGENQGLCHQDMHEINWWNILFYKMLVWLVHQIIIND